LIHVVVVAVGAGKGMSFRKHVQEEHNVVQYLYYFHYLKNKDRSLLNSLEKYVLEKVTQTKRNFFQN
jgi:hypothetical protein